MCTKIISLYSSVDQKSHEKWHALTHLTCTMLSDRGIKQEVLHTNGVDRGLALGALPSKIERRYACGIAELWDWKLFVLQQQCLMLFKTDLKCAVKKVLQSAVAGSNGKWQQKKDGYTPIITHIYCNSRYYVTS